MVVDTRDVIVIGAGIVGCLTGYLLAKQGLKVTILEADSVGSHASGFAFGGLGPLDGSGIPDPLLEFSGPQLRPHNAAPLPYARPAASRRRTWVPVLLQHPHRAGGAVLPGFTLAVSEVFV